MFEEVDAAFVECSKAIVECYEREGRHNPIFRRLQSWIIVSRGTRRCPLRLTENVQKTVADCLPSSVRDTVVKPMEHPSPQVLLLSWLILAIAIAACYRMQSSHRHRRHYLIGSMLVAFVIGGLEGSGMTTAILTNVPWCLTIGALLQLAINTGIRAWHCRRTNGVDHTLRTEKLKDLEKAASSA